MIGVVSLDGAPADDLAGLPLPLRTLLLMQAEGAEWLGLLGDRAAETAARWSADDRVRVPLRALTAAPRRSTSRSVATRCSTARR